jgi:integrase
VYPQEGDQPVPKPLTAAAVAKYRPAAGRRLIRDAGAQSLYLVVHPSGRKSWMMRFRRPSGKPGKIVLGPVHAEGEPPGEPTIGMPLTLAGARMLAAAVHRERAQGRDPVADHKARRHRQRAAIEERAAGTFGACVRRFAHEHARVRTRKWRYTLRQLGLHYPIDGGEPTETAGGLAQLWADRPARDVDAHDVYAVVEEARRIGTPGIPARTRRASEARARDLHSALSSLFGWLHRHRLVDANPAAGVHRPPTAMARDRALSESETRWFWQACDEAGEPFGAIFRLLVLTGQRLGEVAGMRWDELSEDGTTLALPAMRTKNRRAHVVPLAPAAQAIIAAAPRVEGCRFVFSTTGRTPVSGWSKVKRRLDAAMVVAARAERGPDATVPPWRLHDLRRTAVTGMAELGIAPHVIEMAVNHVSGHRGGVAGVYNKSELLPERRAALERWAAHVAGLVEGKPANVADLAALRRGR